MTEELTQVERMYNNYSATWFSLFLQQTEPPQTDREVEFLRRWLPNPPYRSVLDLCCGTGRHASRLAAQGYEALGVDRSAEALGVAREKVGEHARFVEHDMREVGALPGSFDGVICLWQSFGYFDDATNESIMRQIFLKLRPGGRLILDVYHRDFFAAHQGERAFTQAGLEVRERKWMEGKRLKVELDYGTDVTPDSFEWRLYTPEELIELGEACGFRCVTVCADFDEGKAASPAKPRMQVALEKQ